MLQIQMRDLHGFMVTRHTLLTLKSNGKPNWLAFALARHLTGDVRGAISVIDIYLGTLSEGSPELDRGFESSELALYRNSLLAEAPNNYDEALKHLDDCEGVVVDRGAWMTARAKYQLKLGDFDAAHKTTMQLLERGMTEDFRIHSLYMICILKLDDEKIVDNALRLKGTRTLASFLPLTNEQKQTLRAAYQDELSPLYPKSYAIQRIPLVLIHDQEELVVALDRFCRKDLTKGVPSLCSELACLVLVEKDGVLVKAGDPVDIMLHPTFRSIVKLVDGYVENLTFSNKFAPSDDLEEAPSTLLWTLYLRAGLYELEADYIKGVQTLDRCLEHTPTAVDAYELKARLLRAAGDIKTAVDTLDHGRDLDRQDRYINNQTTRYMLLAGMEEEALKRISLFTRHEGNPEQNLFDMQCSWYELELAACMRRKGEWGRSLKKYCKSRGCSGFTVDKRLLRFTTSPLSCPPLFTL
jgi:N-alpha-acetyltransferase 15/16, NatA auxiliary subunit